MNTLALFFTVCVSLITAHLSEEEVQHVIENVANIQDRTGVIIDNMYQLTFPVYNVKEEDISVAMEGEYIEMKVYSHGAVISSEIFKAPSNTIDPYWSYKDGVVTIHLPVFRMDDVETPEIIEKEAKVSNA